jgi:hypothetical protein
LTDSEFYGNPVVLDDDAILGFALFPEDLRLYKTIKARSVNEYIHQHMEFFDFETGLKEVDDTKTDAIYLDAPTRKI